MKSFVNYLIETPGDPQLVGFDYFDGSQIPFTKFWANINTGKVWAPMSRAADHLFQACETKRARKLFNIPDPIEPKDSKYNRDPDTVAETVWVMIKYQYAWRRVLAKHVFDQGWVRGYSGRGELNIHSNDPEYIKKFGILYGQKSPLRAEATESVRIDIGNGIGDSRIESIFDVFSIRRFFASGKF